MWPKFNQVFLAFATLLFFVSFQCLLYTVITITPGLISLSFEPTQCKGKRLWCCRWGGRFAFSLSFFWEGSTFSDAVSDGTQPASCVDIQNRQSTYSCRCPMYGACQNDVFCGLFYSATLAIRCRSKAPFVHVRLKTPNTSPQAVEPDP